MSVLRNTAIVGAFTALSRVLGLVREMLQSRFIGAGVEQSAFALAFAIPNMARKLFGEGALTAAFIPVFKGELENNTREKALRLARAIITMSLLMLGTIVVLALLAAGGISACTNLSPRVKLTLDLVRTLLPYMLFICGAAFGMGVLNAMGYFKAAGFMPCLLNVFWILGLAALVFFPGTSPATRIRFIAWVILAAGALQMAFAFVCMFRAGVHPRLSFEGWRDEKVRLVWHNTLIAAAGAGAVQINYMLDTALAQIAAPWAAGVMGYAERLMDLPLGVIGASFGMVLLPSFAGAFARNDLEGARTIFISSARNMLFVMIPAAVGLGVLAPEIVSAIYKGGAFDEQAVTRVARAVSCYAFGLAFFGLHKALVPWFQGQNDMKTPLKVASMAVLVNAALNLGAVFLLPCEWRHVGLAASTVLCSALSCFILGLLAHKRNGSMGLQNLISPISRIVIASIVMGVVLFLLRPYAVRGLGYCHFAPFLSHVLLLALLVIVGGVVYSGLSLALMPDLLRAVRRGHSR